MSRMLSRPLMFTIIGLFFTVVGTLTVLIWPTVLHSIVDKKLVLSNVSENYKEWKESSMPMRLQVYLFDWVNAHLTTNESLKAKPILLQRGPYVFREHRDKRILGWNDENGTVTYEEVRTWFFEPELSNGSLSDEVTTVNVPALTTAYTFQNASPVVKTLANWAFGLLNIHLPVTKTVREWVFEGYTNPLMDITKYIPDKYLPVKPPFDKFGWFYERNGSGTYDGVFNMETGAEDVRKVGRLARWNYENRTTVFESYCAMVNGSAGELFGPEVRRTGVSFYMPDICRPIVMDYVGDVKDGGISALRFKGSPTMFMNKTSHPDNWCFHGKDPSISHPDGVLDISTCKWGAPLFVSFPHFYEADPFYLGGVDGLHPDAAHHEMNIDIEPLTGVPVHASAGLQINVLLQPIPSFNFLKNMPRIYFPAIWFKEVADVSGDTETELRGLSTLSTTPIIVGFTLLALGLTILVILGVFLVTRRCHRDEDDYLIGATEDPDS